MNSIAAADPQWDSTLQPDAILDRGGWAALSVSSRPRQVVSALTGLPGRPRSGAGFAFSQPGLARTGLRTTLGKRDSHAGGSSRPSARACVYR